MCRITEKLEDDNQCFTQKGTKNMDMPESKLVSRFVSKGDKNLDKFIFDHLSIQGKWSRIYEYAWVSEFAQSNDVVLDAACGVFWPLKFYLSEHCKQVYACDIDKRLNSKDLILNDIKNELGEKAYNETKNKASIYDKIKYAVCSLTKLPYQAKTFDKIFCVSVLEHLNQTKWNKLNNNILLRDIIKKSLNYRIYKALSEFSRTLKDDGLIILTFDYPRVDLNYIHKFMREIGLEYAGPNMDIPATERVYNENEKLYCYRAVLKKKNNL